MKKIGTTNEGNIIVEMTPDEWRVLNETGKGEITRDDLIVWKNEFQEKILLLELSARTESRLLRAAGIWKGTTENPYVRIKESIFKRNEKLLPFDKWIKSVLAGDINCMSIKGFGKVMQSELEAAIRRYLDAN